MNFTETKILIVGDDKQAKGLLPDRILMIGIKNIVACENGKVKAIEAI